MPVSQKLAQKILAVVAAVSNVPKNGTNAFQKYKYVQEADILDAIREELVKNNLIVLPSARHVGVENYKTDKNNFFVVADMVFTIVDCETGETVECCFEGHGIDTGDKGLYKAYTGAMKYFLLKTFMIPTGDDPEKTTEHDKPATTHASSNNQQSASDGKDSMTSLYKWGRELGYSGQTWKDLIQETGGDLGKIRKELDQVSKELGK